MSGRPEGNDTGGYDQIEPVDERAWQEFTPWRPGDKPAAEQSVRDATAKEPFEFKWTEDQPEEFDVGDRVRNTKPVGGLLGGAVPTGTYGEVVSTRAGFFEEYVTVRFENGYEEEIKPTDIEYKGWF